MPDPTHINVTSPPGRLTPIHSDDGAEPGGGIMYVEPGTVRRVRYSQTTRRALRRGDLIACDMNGAETTVTLAAAPHDLAGASSVEVPPAADLAGAGEIVLPETVEVVLAESAVPLGHDGLEPPALPPVPPPPWFEAPAPKGEGEKP